MTPAITFDALTPRLAPDPNRMDLGLMVGFLPLSAGGRAARAAIAADLAANGWAARANDDLTDLPVRLTSLEVAEALFDLDGRPDRLARVQGDGLAAQITVPADQTRIALSLDGVEAHVDLPEGPLARADLPGLLAPLGVTVSLGDEDAQGRAALVFTRGGIGAITVYANPALGLPLARADQARATGCPMGAALRGWFLSGGREVVVVPMGMPPLLYADVPGRIAALGRLVGGGYGAGADDFAALAAAPVPGVAPAYPPRDPWHGLAHLHGLPDVSLVMLPDLAELVASTPGVAPSLAPLPEPAEIFQVCTPDPTATLMGQARPGTPARADVDGVALWSRLAEWLGAEVARITPEAMALAALPLADAVPPLPQNPQLQLVAPLVVSPAARGLPGRAMGAEAILGGAIAGRTLARGAWVTVAGQALPAVTGVIEPLEAPGLSLIGRRRGGFGVLTDLTCDPGDYAQAATRRLVALVLRAARHRGEAAAFEPNGPALWRDVAMALRGILRRLHSAGALQGVTEEAAFTLRCGPDTMSQADIDAGRVIATAALTPAASLERIEITLIARDTGAGQEVAA